MPATRVKSRWVDGNLVFYDTAGNIIFTFDGVNRRMDFPATGILSIAGTQVNATAAELNSVSAAITVQNETTGNLDAGTLVYLSGIDGTSGLPTITAASLTEQATHVLTEDIDDGETGQADEEATVGGLDTDGQAVGDLVYLDAAGAFTFSAPTGADELAQVVGLVTEVDATAGEIYFFPGYPLIQAIGTSGIQAEAITKTEIANGIIKVETSVIDASGGDGTEDIVVLPANSVITDVHVLVTTGFDGDSNQTIDIGIGGNTDKYLATADIETAGNNIADNDEEFASTIDKAPVSEPAGETVVATWTNNASAAAGEFRVSVSYYVEDV